MASNRSPRQRSQLRDERFYKPAFGVLHRVIPTDELDFFFSDLESKINAREPIIIRNDTGEVVGERPQAILFSAERLSLRVVERRITERYGKGNRYQWHPRDRGRVQQEIADQIGKYDLGGRVIHATMGDVLRLGDADAAKNGEGRVFAMIPKPSSTEADFFATEHEIAVNAIPDRYKNVRTTAPYIPHVSIGRIHADATPKQVSELIDMATAALPLELQLHPLMFTPSLR